MYNNLSNVGGDDNMLVPKREKKVNHSIYEKQNKAYQALLATLIIALVLIGASVLTTIPLPTSSVWRDNVLLRMIVDTQHFIKQGR